MPTTSNFGWTTPADTDLVKDGAAAIRTLANGIDTSLVDLKGGTTGQVLSKASNTDLDYQWISTAVGDITSVNAGTGISGGGTSGDVTITNSMATAIDAKGDLIAGTGADAFSRLAVGTDGNVLTADSTTATGLKWAAPAEGWTLLNTGGTTMTGSSISVNSIPSTYRALVIVVRDPDPSASGGPSLRIRFGGVDTHYTAVSSGGINVQFTLTGATIAEDCNQTTPNGLATATIVDYANSDTAKVIEVNSMVFNSTTSTNANITTGVVAYSQTTAISSFSLFFTSGNMDGGTLYVYGVK